MTEKNLPKIIYLGSDQSYWDSLCSKFREIYETQAFEFLSFYGDTSSEIQKLIIAVRLHRPKIVFVDLAQVTSEMLHVVRVLTRLNGVHKPFVVGLVDLNQTITPTQRAILAGITCVHIKSVEFSSVVYNSMCYQFPDLLVPHGFATAKLSDTISARVPVMISIISPEGMRVESNIPLSIGERYPIHTRWSDKGILKTPLVQCASSTAEDLYYNYKYAQEFGFEFVEDVLIDDKMTEEEIWTREHQYEKDLEESHRLLDEWIVANQENSSPKSLKTLVIDKELNFYYNDKLTDEFPFVLRCQPYLKEVKSYLKRVLPQLIIYNMDHVTQEELEANQDLLYTYNDINNLKLLVKNIKKLSNYDPYIIVFGAEGHDTKSLQLNLNYNNIISYADEMTTDLVLKMSDMLKNKLMEKIVRYDEHTIFLQKDHPSTYAELEIDISLVAVSENDIYFNSDTELDSRTVLRITTPVDMYISLAPIPKNSQIKSQYYAVIHNIGEIERSELRKFINSVFFRKLEEKKQKEKESVEALKNKVIDQKVESQKKEESDKKKAQEAQLNMEKEKERSETRNKVINEDEK